MCTRSVNCIEPRLATLLPQNHTVSHIKFFGVPNLKQTGSYRYKFRYNLCLTTSHLTQPGLSPASNGNHMAPDVLTCTDDGVFRSEEHTCELQSRGHVVCRLLLETRNQWQLLYPNTVDLPRFHVAE